MELIGVLFVLGVVGYAGVHAYLFFAKPEVWERMQQRKYELEKAKLAEEEAKRKAATKSFLAELAQAAIGAAIKGRGHH